MADTKFGFPQSSDGAPLGLHDMGGGTYALQVYDNAAGGTATATIVGTMSADIIKWGGTNVLGGAGNAAAGAPRTVQAAAGTLNFGQVAVGTATTSVLGTNTARIKVTFINHGTNDVYLGTSTAVSTASGFLLKGIAGYQISIRASVPVWGIAGTAQTISYIEEQQ